MSNIFYNPPTSSSGSSLVVDQLPKTGNFTANNNMLYLLDTSGGTVTVFSPVTPTTDSCFVIFDLGSAGTNNISINFTSQGHNLAGDADNFTIDVDNAYVKFRYINTSIGYIIEY